AASPRPSALSAWASAARLNLSSLAPCIERGTVMMNSLGVEWNASGIGLSPLLGRPSRFLRIERQCDGEQHRGTQRIVGALAAGLRHRWARRRALPTKLGAFAETSVPRAKVGAAVERWLQPILQLPAQLAESLVADRVSAKDNHEVWFLGF